MQRLVCLLTVLCLMPLAASGKTVHRVLSNGLTVVVKEDRSSPVVAMQAWVKTGSVTEGKYMGSGLSHYYEHMLFKGTKKLKVGDYSAQIRAAGGADLNAYTTTNRTVYHFTILSKHFDLGLRNLSDILMNATFPEDEVKKEMPVIFREMDQGADNPDKVMWLSFMQTMYKVHPYRHPVIGYKQVFQALTRDAILDYYKSGYSPSNIIFIVVGDVDAEQAAAKIARQFEPYKRRSIQPVFVPREPEPTIARRLEKRFHVKKARLRIGWKTVSARHPDMPALDLLSAILGSGESSRLVRSLKDRKQLVLSTSAWSWTPQWEGALVIDARLEDKHLAQAGAEIDKLLAVVRKDLVSKKELKRAVNKLLADHVLSNQRPSDQARQLGWSMLVGGDVNFHDGYARRLKAVTPEQIRAVARKYIQAQRRVTVVLRPKEAKSTVSKNAGVKQVSAAELHRLPNGLRILLRENHSVPAVHLHARGLGGALFESEAAGGATNMMAELLTKGTKTRSASQIVDQIEAVGGRIAGSGGNNTFGITVDLLSKDMALGLEVLVDCLRNPSFPAGELAKMRKQFLARIAAQSVSPWAITDTRYNKALFKGHPYSRFRLGTRKSVSQLSREDVQAAWSKLCSPKNLVVAVYGDFDSKAVLAALTKRFADWQGADAPDASDLKTPRLEQGILDRVVENRFRQTILRIGFPTVKAIEADRIPLAVMAKVLGGMGSRLFVSLRDKQSLAYSVGCWSASYFAGGSFVFYIVTTEDKLAQAHAGLKKQIEGAKSTLTEAELKRAQQALIGQEVTQSATNSEQAMKAVLDLLYGAGINASKADVAKIEKVTVADLHRVARKYFDLARAVTVILTQEKQERELGKKAASEKSNPQATPRGALALGIKLLREKAYRQFLEKMLHPTERQALVRGSSMDELAAEFAKQKAGPLLKLLEGLGDQKPRLLEDGRTAIFQDESGQDLELAKVGDRWYLVN